MKAYWILGCLIMGMIYGASAAECPNARPASAVEMAAAVAVWPAVLLGSMVYLSARKSTPPSCHAAEAGI